MTRFLLTLAVLVGTVLGSAAQAGDKDGFKPLFDGKTMTGWIAFLKGGMGDPNKVFVIKDGMIQVTGEPFGYLYTDTPYQNYTVRYTWRYPRDQPAKTTLNSGLLMHIIPPNAIWPKCVEAQGRYKDHGKLFFMGFPKAELPPSTFDQAAQKRALKPADAWNTTEVTTRTNGTMEVRINGVLVSTAKNVPLSKGPLGFQSEGARIDLKDIQIKLLD